MKKFFAKGNTNWKANIGRKHSDETKRKMSESHKGRKPYIMSDETKAKLRAYQLGRKRTPEHILNMSLSRKGKIPKNVGISFGLKGERHYLWKGGATPKNKLIRNSSTYRKWRHNVFERDNYTCVLCGQRGVYLEADHIKPFAFFEDLRFELLNGRTLCRECHSKTDTYRQGAYKYDLDKSLNCHALNSVSVTR